MNIQAITLEPLRIPFKESFKHHSADRRTTESVLARVVTADGHIGHGEGCPRGYVTGEDVPACLAFFERHRRDLTDLRSVEDLQVWVQNHEMEIDLHPAAWCALELALLEAFSLHQSQAVEKTLGLPELAGAFHYTAVLGDSAPAVFQAQLARYASVGFQDFKVKISGDPSLDAAKLAFLLPITGARVRLDANNLWTSPSEVLDYLDRLPLTPFALEEPLRSLDYEGLSALAKQTSVPLILDESFLGLRHFAAARKLDGKVFLNLRVSKLGGLIRSLAIARQALDAQIPVVVGAHVGETSILTRAALVVAQQCRGNLIAQEGAYGTHLLETDIVAHPLVFGRAGVLEPRNLLSREHGFQLEYEGEEGR